MYTRRTLALAAALACPAFADNFGTGTANEFTMDFVDITGGTTADNTGYGAVGNDYRMGVNEVSGAMIDAYNANSGGPAITRFTGFSASQPATEVSWNEAARFVNWLNTSQGHSAAYNFTTGGGNDNITLWGVGHAGYDASNPFRNSNAYYFLPSEDEWYRAAYYDPSAGAYWDFATGSDTAPVTTSGGTAAGTAVYREDQFPPGPADITNAGGLSPFGTMAQNGNLAEWAESGFTAPNDTAGESRVLRGGGWSDFSNILVSSLRSSGSPTGVGSFLGFRVASVASPPPEEVILKVKSLEGNILNLTVENIPNRQIFHLRQSSDGESFEPLPVIPALDITAATPQPIAIAVDWVARPTLLIRVYEGATPDP